MAHLVTVPRARQGSTSTARAGWWRQLFQILDGAFELAPEQRASYLEHAPAADPAAREGAKALLADGEAPGLLDRDALEFASALLDALPPDPPAPAPTDFGSYRLLREIGHGGMGSVYLAERADRQYQKTVALKLLRGWSAADDRLVRRFLEERQILATLDHPDIARLLDGGVTPDGLPWFAMEYVEGVPIDRYADEQRLPVEGRLRLFCQVCAAVQYAHRNLVVHRDLKPANILVTAEGRVKLLDFGIAKLLGGDAAGAASLTVTGERLMTPLYASPEQIRGEPISTAADVYALGVLLYELLTGQYPYRLTNREAHEVAGAILEQEPERPSAAVLRPCQQNEGKGLSASTLSEAPRCGLSSARLARRLRGDLDTIVLTAMQKDPAKRYESATQLAADVERHLAGLPLVARPENRLSRMRKFARRHRMGVSVAAAVAFLVIAFAVVAGVQAVRIRAQAARITVERDRAAQVSDFLAGLFRTPDPFAGGTAGLTAREILDSGAARIDRELAGQPETRAQMMLEMGRAYFGLGAWDRARRLVETSLAIRRRTSPSRSMEMAQTLDVLGVVLLEQGDLESAERAYRDALTLRRRASGAPNRDVARTLNGLARTLRAAGRYPAADSISREAAASDEGLGGANELDLAESLEGVAHATRQRSDFTGAEVVYRHARGVARQRLPSVHPVTATILLGLGELLLDQGKAAGAEPVIREALAMRRTVFPPGHVDVAEAEQLLGTALVARGQFPEAERYLLSSYPIVEAAFGDRDPHSRAALRRLVALYQAWQMPAQAAGYRARLAEGAAGDAAATARTSRAAPPGTQGTESDQEPVALPPFRIIGAEPGMADLRDWIQDLVSARLGGEGGLRVVDAGARWQLLGEVAGSPRRLSLEVVLVATAGGTTRGHARVEGTADSLPQMADRLSGEILASFAARDAAERAAFARTSLPALRAYLAGRAVDRRGDPPEPYFERALSLDSAFVPAAVALAAKADLLRGASRPGERWKFDAVWARRGELDPADRALLTAYLGPRYPRPSTLAERIAAAEQAVQVAPARLEAWFLLGDNLERFGSLTGYPHWKTLGADAFRHALALDSTYAQAMDRLLLLAADAGDRRQVERYASGYFAQYPHAESSDFLRWATALALGDSTTLRRLRPRFAEMSAMSLQRIVVWSDRYGLRWEDARLAASVLLDRAGGTGARRVAMSRMMPTLLNRGQPGEARRLLAESEAGFGLQQGVGSLDFRIYAARFWDGDTGDAAAAARRLESYVRGGPLRPTEARDRSSAACALAHWRLAGGDLRGAQAALIQARRLAAPIEPAEPLATPVCLAAAEAELAAAQGRPHGQVVARLDSLLLAARNSRDLLLTVGNLVAARLYEASGDLARALERVRRRAGWEAFLSTQLREEGRLAALSGDRDGAVRAYRHYLALRSDPEPALRADAARVRAELTRLERSEQETRRRGMP